MCQHGRPLCHYLCGQETAMMRRADRQKLRAKGRVARLSFLQTRCASGLGVPEGRVSGGPLNPFGDFFNMPFPHSGNGKAALI